MNEINYNYARTNNKGIILLPESLRIDTISKIESLLIKLKNFDGNGNKKINFSRNDDSYLSLLQETILTAQKWHEHQKIFPNSIKSSRYIGDHRKHRF
jgi:hypothetical protein